MKLSRQELASLPRIHEGQTTLIHLWHDDSGKPVVVKALRHDHASPRQVERLRNEYELTRGLFIRGVRTARDSVDLDGRPALIMEYVEGCTVGETLTEGGGDLAEVLTIGRSISRSLDELHRHGIIHRNISSSNILVDPPRKEATIIDLAIAIRVDPRGEAPPCPGLHGVALPYVSPELTGRINRSVDQRSDLYSLGALLYEMLTGRLPFAAGSVPELIHCHIAGTPRPACELRPDLPPIVSDMLIRLMAKNPDERYQSAHGLMRDLERCLDCLHERGEVEAFKLGQDDVSGVFRVPARLYGRERERAELVEAVDCLASGRGGTFLVSGAEGVGKSALVNELRRHVAVRGGYFIAGHYDVQRHNVPYHGVLEACDRLVDLMLTESGEQLARRRETIGRMLGESLGRLTEVLPRLELVMGGAPLLGAVESEERRGRFRYLLQRFIAGVSHQEHPLVLFLDNLQWADDATLQLLRLLATAPESSHLLLICAYQEGEGDATPGWGETVECLRSSPVTRGVIRLESLSLPALESLIADTLGCEAEHVRPLAELVHDKSGGNALFSVRLLQSLHDEGLIRFDGQFRRWTWDADRIRGVAVTDNLVSLMTDLIARLPAETRNLLSLAACIGAGFDLEQLAALADTTPEVTAGALGPAVAERLLLPLVEAGPVGVEESCRAATLPRCFVFAHERVRRVAYALLSRKRRRTVHLAIGRLLLHGLGDGTPGEALFTIADHLNEAFRCLEDDQERLSLVRLNLSAGRRARRTAAYRQAIWYLSMGMGMLLPDRWLRSYDLTLELYLEAVEAEYLSGNFERAELLAGEALLQARELPPRARFHELMILVYMAQNRNDAAIRAGLEALSLLNIYLPAESGEIAAFVEDGRSRLSAEPELMGVLTRLPLLDDPRQLAARKILMNLSIPAHRANSPLLPAIVLSVLLMSLKGGNSPLSALAYAWYGALLCGAYDDVEQGWRFGQLALEVLQQFRSPEMDVRVEVLFNTLVRHWREHGMLSAKSLGDVFQRGIVSGDLEYSCDAAVHHCGYLVCCGAPLEYVRLKQQQCLENVERLRLEFHGGFVRVWGQVVLNLQGRSPDPCRLSGELLDESRMLQLWTERNEPLLVFNLLCCRTMLQYLFGNHADAIQTARLAESFEGGAEAYLYRAHLHFYHALALLGECTSVDAATREEYLGRVASIQRRMERWAEHAPMNFRHKCDLIQAEHARVMGDSSGAMESFGRAIRGAGRHGYLHEEALSREREAEMYLALGRDDLAGFDMGKAVELYRQWGATAKVGQLEGRHRGGLIREKPVSEDCAAIMAASRALSQEVRLEQLLDRMMRIVIENAGAEKGILVENRNGHLIVQAKGCVGHARVETMQETPIESSAELSLAVANYVARTQTPLVLNDAGRDVAFAGDAYIAEHGIRSLLCLPIVHQGRLSGLLYLENNLTTNAFTPDRLELLKALSSQAAISMKNAALYADLEKTIGEVRRAELFLQQLLDTIPLPVLYKDTAGVYLGCNSAFEEFCGLPRESVVGKCVYDLAPRDLADIYCEADAALFSKPGVQVYEAGFQGRDGSMRDVIFNRATYVDADGRVAGLVGVITDITRLKQVERELLLSNDMLRAIIQAVPTAIIGLDLDGRVRNVWNPAAEKMLGWSAEEVMGRLLPDLEAGESEEHGLLREWLRTGRPLDGVEVRRRRRDGSPIDCSIYASPLHDTEGGIVGSIAALVDVTGRKRAEEALRLATLIVENSPAVLFRWRAAEGWPVELVSRNVTRFGYMPDELTSGALPFSALVHPDDLQRVASEVADFCRRGLERFQQEYRIVTRDGAVRWIDDRSVVERDSQGRISHFQGVVMDITERKWAEEALRESEEKFRILAQTSPTAIILVQGERIVYANQAASQISGYDQEQLLGMDYREVVHSDFREQIRMCGLAWQRGKLVPGRYESKIVTREGDERWVVVSGASMEYGGRPAIIVTLLDITETKRAGERIRDALAEKEILLREIHHRVKNNLQIISTLLDLQSESLRDEGALRAFRESQDRIRAMALVHEKLYRTENLSSIDFSGYIESLATQLYDGYAMDPERVSLRIDAGTVCLGIDQAIPCGLIINELVSNSLKYAFPGSREGEIVIRFREEENGMIRLMVADNGVGLPDTLGFTAGETLGLQLVRMLIKQLKGEVTLDTSHGTSFCIRFPGSDSEGAKSGGGGRMP